MPPPLLPGRRLFQKLTPFCTLSVTIPKWFRLFGKWQLTASLKQCYCSKQTGLGKLLKTNKQTKNTELVQYKQLCSIEVQIKHYMQFSCALHKCNQNLPSFCAITLRSAEVCTLPKESDVPGKKDC